MATSKKTNTTMTLVLVETTQIANKKLVTQFNKINKAYTKAEGSKWEIADAVNTILTDKLYEEDFGGEEALAKYMNMSRPSINKMKRASEYHKNDALKDFQFTPIAEMLVIKLEDIPNFLASYEITSKTSTSKVREAVKAWQEVEKELKAEENKSDDTEENTEADATEETPDTEVVDERDIDALKAGIIEQLNGLDYNKLALIEQYLKEVL